MPKVKNDYFNYLAMYKSKDGTITRKKMYRNMEELIEDYKNEYSIQNIKCRCARTNKGVVKYGLLVYSVRVPLYDPSMLIINKTK